MKNSITSSHNLDPAILARYSTQTPVFIFSKQTLIDTYREYIAAFPGATIHYAMKANGEPELLEILAKEGASFEVASSFELDLLKKISVAPEKILYGSSVKPIDHIKAFVEYGVTLFTIDSMSELEKIAAHAPGARILVRVSVNDSGSVFKFSEKFGTTTENAITLLTRAQTLGLIPYGISFHVGSQASNVLAWGNALEHIQNTLIHLKEVSGITLGAIDIGGGYPCTHYASSEASVDLADIAEATFASYKKLLYQPKLLLEPGRGMVASAGTLLVTVIARIERNEHTWLFLDAGVYNGLFETMAYQGSTRYRVTPLRQDFNAGEKMFALAGPTGDSPDVISRETLLPEDIAPGDVLVFHDVGAYTVAVTSNFNGFPKPAVRFV